MKSVLMALCFMVAAGLAAGMPDPPPTPSASVDLGTDGAVVVKRVQPKYPFAMRLRGIEGVVEFEIDVDAQGTVVGITTVSTTRGVFVAPARAAVWQWQFAKSEKLLPDECARYRFPVEFKLGRG